MPPQVIVDRYKLISSECDVIIQHCYHLVVVSVASSCASRFLLLSVPLASKRIGLKQLPHCLLCTVPDVRTAEIIGPALEFAYMFRNRRFPG